MADVGTFIKSPEESIKAFNTRIATACEEAPVTHITGCVIDGQPAISLRSGEPGADALDELDDDQEDADASAPSADFGDDDDDDLPELCCAVVPLGAGDPKAAARSESLLNKVYEKAAGTIVDIETLTGHVHAWVQLPDSDHWGWVQTTITYQLIVWELLAPEDEDGEDTSATDQETEIIEKPEEAATKPAKSRKKAREVEAEVVTDDDDEGDD